jgi:hypothetical protein
VRAQNRNGLSPIGQRHDDALSCIRVSCRIVGLPLTIGVGVAFGLNRRGLRSAGCRIDYRAGRGGSFNRCARPMTALRLRLVLAS